MLVDRARDRSPCISWQASAPPRQLAAETAQRFTPFDLALQTAFPGGFAVMGVTIFGSNAPLGQFGLQAQFADIEAVEQDFSRVRVEHAQ